MKKTLILMSSNREVEQRTRDSVDALCAAGAQMLLERGSACVAFARNRALSLACEALRGPCSDRTIVLMVDDDMEFDVATAQQVVSAARSSGVATSAAYATVTGKLAGSIWKDHPGKWLMGLGCLALPVPLLLELEKRSESFEHSNKAYSQFTWVGVDAGEWMSEDFRFCKNLGGVNLLPLAVGHIKKWRIQPDNDTLQRIAVANLDGGKNERSRSNKTH